MVKVIKKLDLSDIKVTLPLIGQVSEEPLASASTPETEKMPAVSTLDLNKLMLQAKTAALQELKQEAEAIQVLARQKGYQEGKEAGITEMRQKYELELKRINALSTTIEQQSRLQISNLSQILSELTITCLSKILGDVLSTAPGIIALVNTTIAQLAQRPQKLCVRLNPADLSLIRDSLEFKDKLNLDFNVNIEWCADNQLGLGTCVITTEMEEIEARIEQQVSELSKALLAASLDRA